MFHLHLPPNPPKWVWPLIVAGGLSVGVLWAYPELRTSILSSFVLPAPSASPQASVPPGCIPVRFVLLQPADELRILFRRANDDDLHRCNPRSLRGTISNVTDIATYRMLDWSGGRATVKPIDGMAVVALPDDNGGGDVIAYSCEPTLALFTASWGSFVPPELKLRSAPPVSEIAEACVDFGGL